uniref:Uridine kinase n=1 Tax=Steinernema glaseri TaxID=37863 RepID=A0A1I8A2X2_9BILA
MGPCTTVTGLYACTPPCASGMLSNTTSTTAGRDGIKKEEVLLPPHSGSEDSDDCAGDLPGDQEPNERRVKILGDNGLIHASCTSSGSSVNELSCRSGSGDSPTPRTALNRNRTISGSKSEDHLMTTSDGRKVYTKGRPPWYDRSGKRLKKPYLIGICGGSASGKTTVAKKIIDRLEMPWVTVLSMDSFYKVLSPEDHELAAENNYNFDHPDAFDFEALHEVLARLRQGKSVEVPVYDFTTHSRDKNPKVMYGADVLIFEGILAFHNEEINKLIDLKIFVDTDSDTRLARRLQRDIEERGRDIAGVLKQYKDFVKPAFDSFIAPCMKVADIIVPRGGDNYVAIDLILRQITQQLTERGYDASKSFYNQRHEMSHFEASEELPENLTVVKESPQVKGLHTFIRNRETYRDEFIFYSERLMRILIENAMEHMNYEKVTVETTNGSYEGCRLTDEICGISIMRAGETLEKSVRSVVKDCKMGKILIQTNQKTMEPELYYLRLPKNMERFKVLLLDATVATGAAAMMAIRILLDHDVKEENIFVVSLLMATSGIHSLAYAFPKVKLLTSAVDEHLNESYHIIPGIGNFGDRYFGTDPLSDFSDDEDYGANYR